MPTYLISNNYSLDNALPRILCSLKRFPYLALDCEWVTENDNRLPVSLLQIATVDEVYLFRLFKLKQRFIEKLELFLGNRNFIKVGVGIKIDVDLLMSDYKLPVRAWFDLRYLSEHLGSHTLPPRALAIMSDHFLGYQMDKNKEISCSDWNSKYLSERQLRYAHDDVSVAMSILLKAFRLIVSNYNFNADNLNQFFKLLHGDLECEYVYKKK